MGGVMWRGGGEGREGVGTDDEAEKEVVYPLAADVLRIGELASRRDVDRALLLLF